MSDGPQMAEAKATGRKMPVGDDIAYLIPMGLFLVLTTLGASYPSLYAWCYVGRAALVPVALYLLWGHFTKIKWDYWWLGIIVGVLGILQWVPMQLWLQAHLPGMFKADPDAFDPTKAFGSPAVMWGFIAIRVLSASVVVPVMEELFWRDFAWRTIQAPSDFKLVGIGEWDWKSFLGVAAVFATVHGSWWLTAIVWALMIGGLLAYTRSIGACIIAHGVTNLLLGLYVLYHGFYTNDPQWYFW